MGGGEGGWEEEREKRPREREREGEKGRRKFKEYYWGICVHVEVASFLPPTFSGFMRQPLQASVMKPRVSMSGRRPKAAVGSGGPPT